PEVSADDIRLTGVRLKASSPLIGKTIVSSNFRNVWESLLVAVQRGGDYLQPDPSIVFSEGDTIWAVGSVKRLADIEG
ncbi:MAG: TrkA C-terminal domain-containing protein, partial [Duncaniella sp.]|nr:TrkA C-terminal domain-containing protein [Duncaniella sp.]